MAKIKVDMHPMKYKFEEIFTYYPSSDILMPKYKVILNNYIIEADIPIRYGDVSGGIDLFKYINRPLAAIWDGKAKTLTIKGFI